MRTILWTATTVAFGVITLAGFTGIIRGESPWDIALAFLVMLGAGSAARYTWQKAQGPRDLQTARLPKGDDRA
ncbi:hypothetical protein [Actinacidiphila glaucinigra]|uniref:hypothetical protein n=1 Tax=Actinacidiphila glaucinigra TaxID=235986 RepID=UPI0036E860C6